MALKFDKILGKVRESDGTGSTFNGDRPTKSTLPIGTNLGTSTVVEFLEAAFFAFVQASISVNSGTTFYEKGTTQTIAISGTVTANDETSFSNARIDLSTGNDIAFTAQAGAYSASATGIIADTTFIAKIDVGGNGTPSTKSSATKTATFVFPFLHGMSASVLDGSTIYAALTKLIQSQGNKAITLNDTDKYIYFAYPASYPNLASIKDQNGFTVTGSFDLTTITVTGLAGGLSSSYKLYRTALPTSATNAIFTFNF
jgi:hypothetical protein